MTTLNKLEAELILLQDTIDRVKIYVKDPINRGSSHSLVVGELKHRSVALKQTLTEVAKLNTYDLCR